MEHYQKIIDLQDQRAIEFRFQINNMTERMQFMEKTIEVKLLKIFRTKLMQFLASDANGINSQ